MSVRQYIGARYVPRFSDVNGGVWSNVYSYEPLTIVKNGNDYYTSKQSVPVGIAITNTNYWVKTGDYNGAIASLTSRVNDLDDDVSDIKNTLEKNILFIFDSYGGYPNNLGVDLDELLPQVMGLDASHHVSKTKGGIGFTNVNQQGTFLSFLESFTPSLPNKDKFTHVMILGGANDYGVSQLDIGTAIKNTINYIKTYYPIAQPVIGYISQTRDFSQTTRTPQQIWLNIYNACTAYRNCINYGAIYLTGCEYVMRDRSLYVSDGIHPNAAGVAKLAQCIRASFDHGYVDVKYSWDYPCTFNTTQNDYTSGNNIERIFSVTIKNDLTTVSFTNVRLDLVQAAGPLKTNMTKILKINNTVKNIINQASINGLFALASCWNGNTFVAYVPARFFIDIDGDITLHLMVGVMPNPAASVTNLYIPIQGTIAFDTLMT